MARTPLFRQLRRTARQSLAQDALPALSRRDFLKLGAGAAAAAILPFPSLAARTQGDRIAVVGGGLAGLTAAYLLREAGAEPYLYEASNRLGGRVFTQYNFNAEGMFCELGGELVDTNHKQLQGLCAALGVQLQKLETPQGGEELYYFDNRYFSTKQAAFHIAPLVKQIAADRKSLTDAKDEWTQAAKRFDAMSIREYLDAHAQLAPRWLISLIDVAYTTEYGLAADQQSAINLLNLIGTDLRKGFEMYGESDEAYRIAGGSSRLTEALAQQLQRGALIATGHRLREIALDNGKPRLLFDTSVGGISALFDRVVLALPFTTLRKVGGLEALGLSAEKLESIRNLGYGTNAKIMLGTKSRPWRQAQLPRPSNGAFFTDLSVQCTWETSRGQQGNSGILTNFLGGTQGTESASARIDTALKELPAIIPGIDAEWDENARSSFFWAQNENTLGSYSCPLVGQYTTLLDAAAAPENGVFHFAGEHTSAEFGGFMNGAVESAYRVIDEITKAEPVARRA